MVTFTMKRTYQLLSHLFNYPDDRLHAHASECARLLAGNLPQAGDQMEKFLDFAESTPLGRMEEIYTSTFDVNPSCFIFAGYMLLGESFKRGEFLVRLQDKYRQYDYAVGKELADHMAVLFGFLATLEEGDILKEELIGDCLLPVVGKMISGFKTDSDRINPYLHILQASRQILERDLARAPAQKVTKGDIHEKEMSL